MIFVLALVTPEDNNRDKATPTPVQFNPRKMAETSNEDNGKDKNGIDDKAKT